jgi:ribosomal-protein-alanine N-acetyltransferase
LRPLQDSDAAMVAALAGEWQVASKTGRIPYPYELAMAVEFIRAVRNQPEREVIFAVCRQDGELIGCVGASFDGDAAELGYWFGVAYWGQGFASEAARAVLDFVFAQPTITQMTSSHLPSNPASGRVLCKLGFRETRRETVRWRDAEQVDLVNYQLSQADWAASLQVEGRQ